jgi:hypothetical protein
MHFEECFKRRFKGDSKKLCKDNCTSCFEKRFERSFAKCFGKQSTMRFTLRFKICFTEYRFQRHCSRAAVVAAAGVWDRVDVYDKLFCASDREKFASDIDSCSMAAHTGTEHTERTHTQSTHTHAHTHTHSTQHTAHSTQHTAHTHTQSTHRAHTEHTQYTADKHTHTYTHTHTHTHGAHGWCELTAVYASASAKSTRNACGCGGSALLRGLVLTVLRPPKPREHVAS